MKDKFVLGFLLGLTFLLLLSAFTRDWDESVPTDSTVANQIDEYNRYLRVDTSDRLENMFYGFIAGENTLSQHAQYLQFYEQASITQPSAGYGRIGAKAVGGKCELFWHDEDGDEIELTEGGKLVIGYGTASQAIMWNTTEEDGEAGRESQIRATGEQSGGERTTLGYLEFSHDGTSDDQKGRVRIVVNDGNDDDTPSKVAIVFQSDGAIDVGDSVSVLDEDAMGSDSATKLATQQSIKAYVDGKAKIANGTSGTSVFNATLSSANTFQDLDIGSTVTDLASGGLAFLEISTADAQASDTVYVVKPKGFGTSTFTDHYDQSTVLDAGIGSMVLDNPSYFYTMVVVDSSGLVSHGCAATDVTIVVKVVWYIAL